MNKFLCLSSLLQSYRTMYKILRIIIAVVGFTLSQSFFADNGFVSSDNNIRTIPQLSPIPARTSAPRSVQRMQEISQLLPNSDHTKFINLPSGTSMSGLHYSTDELLSMRKFTFTSLLSEEVKSK